MGKKEIIKNLYLGSASTQEVESQHSYRRFLLENIKNEGWNNVVRDMASWLNLSNFADIEEALLDFLANDEMTKKQLT